jgi:hypothetical protein
MAESGSAKDIALQIKSDATIAVNGAKPLQEDGKGTRRKLGCDILEDKRAPIVSELNSSTVARVVTGQPGNNCRALQFIIFVR